MAVNQIITVQFGVREVANHWAQSIWPIWLVFIVTTRRALTLAQL